MFFKRNLRFLLILFITVAIVSCGGKTITITTENTTITEITLPDLEGMSKSQINTALGDLGINFIMKFETTTDISENTFIRYDNNLLPGDVISEDTEIVVFIATEDMVLPNLTGLEQQEMLVLLLESGVSFTFEIVTNNEIEDQTFSHYGFDLVAGDTVPASFNVPVYIGYNSEKLPDLTGKIIEEIKVILNEKGILYEFAYIINDNFTEDVFVEYLDYEIGDFYPEEKVVINLYKNTFTDNETSLIISKYVDGGDDTFDQAIEIFNPTAIAINLGDYDLAIYSNGSYEATYVINFATISLLPGETYVVANTNANNEILTNADLTSDNLIFDGNDTIQIRYLNNTYIDTIYQIGNRDYSMNDEVFVRRSNVLNGTRTFTVNEWVAFIPTYTEILGSHPIAIPDQIQFTIIDRPFDDPLGGMDNVVFSYLSDGDTAAFTPGFLGDERVRFLGVDTPETYPIIDSWGLEAKAYTTLILQNAIDVYIQSDPDLGYTENYGRHLGLVWVNLGETGLTIDILSSDGTVMRTEHLSGWILLNYHLVLNGYSYNYYSSQSNLVFNNRYLYRWFQDAEKYAAENGLGIHE
ncbi:MAG: lamin tail domain-containing protein [Candidatus Izemoplasmatales bacterium]|nr:lamin tail domain-containing protein [Candidatus Izemoplasmatales bacterium]